MASGSFWQVNLLKSTQWLHVPFVWTNHHSVTEPLDSIEWKVNVELNNFSVTGARVVSIQIDWVEITSESNLNRVTLAGDTQGQLPRQRSREKNIDSSMTHKITLAHKGPCHDTSKQKYSSPLEGQSNCLQLVANDNCSSDPVVKKTRTFSALGAIVLPK